MLCGIHQLHYLPWLRYIEKIDHSDVFIVLDDIQFNKNGWQNRNKIKGPEGGLLLTLPVRQGYQQNIDEVEIAPNTKWATAHWRAIDLHYRKAPFYPAYAARMAEVYAQPWDRLAGIARAMLDDMLGWLGITTRVVYSSELNVPGIATERLVNLCKAVGADAYLTGAHAAGAYLEPDLFEQAGIGLVTQEWHAPEYPQQYPKAGFARDMATLDILFNVGPEETLRLLRLGGGRGEG